MSNWTGGEQKASQLTAKLRFNTSSQTNAVKPVVENFVFFQNSA